MRALRKIAIVAGIAVVVLVGILALVPLLFGDRIATSLRTQIDRSVDARVAWHDMSWSLLRGFPNLSATITGLSVSGVRAFQRDTLFVTRQAKLVLDLGSVIGYLRRGQPIVVREVSFDRPIARLKKLADGSANWNITKPQAATPGASTRAVRVTLRRFRIDDGTVTLDDRQSNLAASLIGLNESLGGDFAEDRFTLSTRTHVDTASASFGGIPYLHNVALDLNANVGADMRAHRFTLANDTLRLNKLVLAVNGAVVSGSPDLKLDLTFSAPSTAFAELLSLVPAIYARDFDKLQTSGSLALSGQIRGAYGPKAFPALAIRARVDGGTFRYPDLPVGVRDIALDVAIDNPGGHVDSTVVDVKRFHAVLGNRPVDGRALVRTPVSDPDATFRAAGSVDLADVARAVKLQSGTDLSGVIAADLSTHARVSDVDAKRYDRVTAAGTLAASRVAIRSSTIPHPIAIDTVALTFTPRAAQLTAFTSTIGASDVRATGSLENVIGFVLHDEDLRGHATVVSNHVDLNEWKSKDKTTEAIPVPARVDFGLDASAARVTYGPLTLSNVKGSLAIKNQRVTMQNLTMGMLGGGVVASGYYETVNPVKPAFDMSVALRTLDIPTAFTSIATVQKLTPIAKYAEGHVSGALSISGLLGQDMAPVLTALAGKGEISTDSLVLRGAPVMQKLAGTLSLSRLESPALGALHAAIDIADGRLHVKPFTVSAGGIDLTTSGSNGIDQSLSYDLALAIPRTVLGPDAIAAITKLTSTAGRIGATLPAGDVVQLRAKIGGTVGNPTVSTSFTGMATSMVEATRAAAQQVAATAVQTAQSKVDSAADAAKAKASAEAERIVAEAERQADSIRAAARTVADGMRREANARVDSLVAKATNPIAKIAAQKAADQLRKQTDQRIDNVIRAADTRADSLVAQARQRAAAASKPQP